MRERFQKDMRELKGKVLMMGNLASDMLVDSVKALKILDTDLAEKVIRRKKRLSEMDREIEEKTLTMVALYQPMAKDMRTLGCVLKIITYLARIGRYGKDIAQVTKDLSGANHIARLVEIPHMAEIASGMVRDAIKAFEIEELNIIKDFSERDDQLDALRWSIFRECVTYMMEDPRNITRCAHYIMVAKYLERCGDHACKIAEKVHYMVTGEGIELK